MERYVPGDLIRLISLLREFRAPSPLGHAEATGHTWRDEQTLHAALTGTRLLAATFGHRHVVTVGKDGAKRLTSTVETAAVGATLSRACTGTGLLLFRLDIGVTWDETLAEARHCL